MLTKPEEQLAEELYRRWFVRYSDLKNPTDINSKEKFEYAFEIGWNNFSLMQKARKANTVKNGFPYPWTKPEAHNEIKQEKITNETPG